MVRNIALLKKGEDPVGAPDFTLPVSIIAQVIPQLDVNIVAQTIPLLNINLASVGDVTLNVNITGTPTINIKTSEGANIVVDKLTQGAYTERQSTLANNGASATMIANNLTYKRGKFFPRGCRGFITSVEIYCDNPGSASRTFTIKISPMPGMGAVITATLSVAGGSSAAWRGVWLRKFWNYDSMFIWVSSDDDLYGRLGEDAGAPYDYYESADEVSWSPYQYRFWFRVNVTGETVGDLPVSGTINTIAVPNLASAASSGDVIIGALGTATLVSLSGCGVVDFICLTSNYPDMRFDIFVDDQQLRFMPLITTYSIIPEQWRNWYCDVGAGSGIVTAKYDTANNRYSIHINVPIHFRRKFEVKCLNGDSGASHDAGVSYLVRLIS